MRSCARPVSMTWTKPFSRMKSKSSWFSAPPAGEVAEFLHRHYPEEALGILTHTADGGMTSLRANPLKVSAAQLCELLMQNGAKSAEPGIVPAVCWPVLRAARRNRSSSGRDTTMWEGQASQLAALCVEAKPGDTVLDLCAAPGGKRCCWLKCRASGGSSAAT